MADPTRSTRATDRDTAAAKSESSRLLVLRILVNWQQLMKAALFAALAALVGRGHAAGLSMADYAHPEHVQLEQAPREFCSVLGGSARG